MKPEHVRRWTGDQQGVKSVARASERSVEQKKKISRTSSGLRDALFDAIERVRDGDMASEDAKAISGLASQIVNTVQLELNVAKLRTQYPADAKLIVPAPLQLGPTENEK